MDEGIEKQEVVPNVPQRTPNNKSRLMLIAIIALGIFIVGGLVTLAMMLDWNPLSFFSKPRTPSEVVGKMLDSITDIRSATYNLKFSFQAEARDADAQPIDAAFPEYKEQKELIKRDAKRLSSLSAIVRELEFEKDKSKKYPASLASLVDSENGLGVQADDIQDPQTNAQYGYRQEQGGEGFTVTMQLETDAAAREYKEALDQMLEIEGKPKTTSAATKAIEVNASTPRVYSSIGFEDISPFPLGLDFDGVYQYLPAEINAQLTLSGQSEAAATKDNDGSYTVAGSLDLGGTSFKAGFDVLKNAQTFYARVNDAPSLGFFDLAAIKGKWIRAVPEDAYGTFLGSVFYRSEEEAVDKRSAEVVQHYQLFFKILKEENLILVKEEFPEEEQGKKTLYHYRILLDRAKLPTFYRRLTEEAKKQFGDDSLFPYNEQTLTYLESDEFKSVFDFLEKNVQLELWIDSDTFLPAKISYSFRLVPPDSVLKLKGKQHRATLAIGLDSINTPISVTVPSGFMSVDEARMLLTGETLEEIKFSRQSAQVRAIRDAIRNYYDYTGKDPKDLSELLQKINDVTPRAGLDLTNDDELSFANYTLKILQKTNRPFLTVVPKDIYTGTDYAYVSDGKSYTLKYQIQLPAKNENSITDYSFESRARQYVSGINTATEKVESLESENGQKKN